MAKAAERGRRKKLEVPVAVVAGRLPVTWKDVWAYHLAFNWDNRTLRKYFDERKLNTKMLADWRSLRRQV